MYKGLFLSFLKHVQKLLGNVPSIMIIPACFWSYSDALSLQDMLNITIIKFIYLFKS